MRIISFKIPKTRKETYHFQADRLEHFYDKLHQHPEVQITWVKKSTGTLIAGDYIGKFSPGDIFIIGSSLPHVFRNEMIYYRKPRRGSAFALSLYVDINAWADGFWSAREATSVGNFFKRCYSAYRVQGNLKKILSDKLQGMEMFQGFDRILCMLELLYQIYSRKRDLQIISTEGHWHTIKESDGQRMGDVIRFSLEESHRAISLGEVARIANMTEEAFCRYFKAHTRKTYISFLNEIRINNACRLLSEANYTKSDVAYRTGFNNLSHFNRTFKQITGKTPGEYASMLTQV